MAKSTSKIEKGAAVLSNLPIDVIDVKPGFNPRGDDVGDVTDLVEMIRKRELLNPVTVCPSEKPGRYYLVAGARRLKAVREAGHGVVACNVRTDVTIDSPDALAMAMVENDAEGRQPLPPLAQANAFQRLMGMVEGKSDTEKHKAVAKLCGRTSDGAYQNVRQTLRLLEVKGAVADLLGANSISKWTAIAVTQAPENIRDKVAARVTPGMTEVDVKRLIRDLTHESTTGVTGTVVDLAEDGEAEPSGDEPARARKPARPNNPPAKSPTSAPASRPLLMRNRSEIDEKVDELVNDMLDAIEDDKADVERDTKNRLAALLWASGAVKEISPNEKEFKVALKALVEKAENERGRVTVRE